MVIKKILVSGKVFSKNFKIKFNDNIDNINFKFLKTGIDTDIYLKDKKNFISGVLNRRYLKQMLNLILTIIKNH